MIWVVLLLSWIDYSKTAWQALGQVNYGRKSSEQSNAQFRRSLYFVKDLKAGDIITEDAVRSVRPGFGLAPKFLEEIVGKIAKNNISINSPVLLEGIK